MALGPGILSKASLYPVICITSWVARDLLLSSSVSPGLWHLVPSLTALLRDCVNPVHLLGNQWARVLKEL